MVAVWSQSKTYEHGFLILPISLWVAWHEKHKLTDKPLTTAWFPVLLLVLPSLLWVVGTTANISLFEHVAAITSLQLILWALLGHHLTRALYFPILYLVFCIPFGEELVPFLQSITADISVAAVRMTGIPVFRDGLYITIPNGNFEVAEACSGIRFLISSIALGTLFAYMFFAKWWKRLIFVLFSLVFPIIANGVRAYGLILIGHYSNMELATGADHLVYGWVFFSLVIGTNFLIASRFADTVSREAKTCDVRITENVKAESQSKGLGIIFTLSTIILFVGLWEKSINTTEQDVSAPLPPQTLINSNISSSWGISFPLSKKHIHGFTASNQAEFYAATYSLNQQNGELISYQNQLFNIEMWTLKGVRSVYLEHEARDIEANRLEIVSSWGESMNILYWYCINDYCSNNKLKLKLYKAFWLISGKEGYAEVRALASQTLDEDELAVIAKDWISNDSKRK